MGGSFLGQRNGGQLGFCKLKNSSTNNLLVLEFLHEADATLHAATAVPSPWKKGDGSPAGDRMSSLVGSFSSEAEVVADAAAGLDTRAWDLASLEEAGVPPESCAGVLEVSLRVGARRGFPEPLLDPLT